MIHGASNYTEMQKKYYEDDASHWSTENRNPVVGSFDGHNAWKDYDDFLFKDINGDLSRKEMLDFGCGPGRNIVKYSKFFKRIDGVDISSNNIKNARIWMDKNGCADGDLFLCDGASLKEIKSEQYDIVMSTICFQHICVYDIRKSYLNDFFRVLRKGGSLTMQMGFGGKEGYAWAKYKENACQAKATNGYFDVSIDNVEELKLDLIDSGFNKFVYYLRPTGPGDNHKNWIFFSASK